jgi:hypothetical protein
VAQQNRTDVAAVQHNFLPQLDARIQQKFDELLEKQLRQQHEQYQQHQHYQNQPPPIQANTSPYNQQGLRQLHQQLQPLFKQPLPVQQYPLKQQPPSKPPRKFNLDTLSKVIEEDEEELEAEQDKGKPHGHESRPEEKMGFEGDADGVADEAADEAADDAADDAADKAAELEEEADATVEDVVSSITSDIKTSDMMTCSDVLMTSTPDAMTTSAEDALFPVVAPPSGDVDAALETDDEADSGVSREASREDEDLEGRPVWHGLIKEVVRLLQAVCPESCYP